MEEASIAWKLLHNSLLFNKGLCRNSMCNIRYIHFNVFYYIIISCKISSIGRETTEADSFTITFNLTDN